MHNNRVFTVSEINFYIKSIFQNDILLSQLMVKGEISNFKRHTSGHLYFTLKDQDSRIKCVMFKGNSSKLKFEPEDGMAVILRGYFSVFERDGQYQFYAEDLTPDGFGALYVAFEQLKAKLSSEGLFDVAHKRPIPFLPQTVGIVTSATGAAVRDIISIIKRRCPMVNILLYPAQVQGETAQSDIAAGIRYFSNNELADVIIVGRGGGSVEELWAFNEEIVARAIFESKIPVISAVGHETDFTIADFVADLRAATPSAAAELAVPDMQNLLKRLNQVKYGLDTAILDYIKENKLKLEKLIRDNNFRNIENKILGMNQTLDYLDKYLHINMQQIIKQGKNRLINNLEKLDLLNPAAALLRGYTYVKDASGMHVINSIEQISIGEQLEICFKDGNITAAVKSISALIPAGDNSSK